MNEYNEFQRIMADIEYFKKHGQQNTLNNIKDKDGNPIFSDIFGDIFNKR